jgi:hypothetical protein
MVWRALACNISQPHLIHSASFIARPTSHFKLWTQLPSVCLHPHTSSSPKHLRHAECTNSQQLRSVHIPLLLLCTPPYDYSTIRSLLASAGCEMPVLASIRKYVEPCHRYLRSFHVCRNKYLQACSRHVPRARQQVVAATRIMLNKYWVFGCVTWSNHSACCPVDAPPPSYAPPNESFKFPAAAAADIAGESE